MVCVVVSLFGLLIRSETHVICRPLKMEAVYSSEILVSPYCTTRCHSLRDNNMKTGRCVEHKSYN